MTNPHTILQAAATPIFAGLAIVLLLSVREMESWKRRQLAGRHVVRQH